MFGESESESPRVPSPWDSLIPSSPSPAPKSRIHTPSPLANELAMLSVPRLVAESDDGNVEYKLQLLDPTPARFASLVTQLKWRLLEGGGQAYYELGVADSEIGASVIVLRWPKLARRSGDCRRGQNDDEDYSSSAVELGEELTSTVIIERHHLTSGVFTMDPDSDTDSTCVPRYSVDLEISNVFKPRPVRTKPNTHHHLLVGGKNKRNKKSKVLPPAIMGESINGDPKVPKAQQRRQMRDKKREEKKSALMAMAAQTIGEPIVIPAPMPAVSTVEETIVTALENLDLTAEAADVKAHNVEPTIDEAVPAISIVADEDQDDDDVFPTTASKPAYP
ncbi:GTP binding protein 2 [Coprinopsis sp. MPI-PUGE-AT-0042]|nr:GTP binding protein 2 [Coprinopsis sp. MPI-PUGE-AT-0042]